MNSPPSNHFLYYNHNLHDPTLVNVHTLLNPQPFKHHTPPSIPTFQSATAQYWASHPPFSHQQQTQQTHHSIPNIYNNNLFNHGPYQHCHQHCPDSSPSFTSSITSNLQPHNLTKQQPTQPLNSTTTTDFLLQQMLQSQQTLNHAISKLASNISTLNKSLPPSTSTNTNSIISPFHQIYHDSLLKTTLTPSSPHLDSHNTTHTFFQQQSFVTQTPFYHQQQLKTAPTSFHHAQHVTLTDEPTLFNAKPSSHPVSISQKPSHHYQPQTISTTATVQLSSPTMITETNTVKTQKPTIDSEINIPIVHENESVVTTKLAEPEINETKESQEIIVDESDFSLTVKSISQVDEEETKCVLDLVAISDPESDFVEEQKRDVIKDLKESFSETTVPSTEMKVVRAVVVETPQQHCLFAVDLSGVKIVVFDPGGTVTMISRSTALHHSKIWRFKVLPLSVFINQISISSFNASPDLHGFNFVVFDPGGDERRFISPVTVLFPARSATMNASSGRSWVPWSRKHKVPKGCIKVFDPGGASFVFRWEFPVATLCQYSFKVGLESYNKWAWCFRLIIGLCLFRYILGLQLKGKKA